MAVETTLWIINVIQRCSGKPFLWWRSNTLHY